MNETENEHWSLVIKPEAGLLAIDFGELWRYRDLYWMLVKRDVVTVYKQTVLGPIWFFVQPILTTIMYMVVFGGIAKIPTDGVPQPLFYLAGICLWQYFSDCLGQTSGTFISYAGVFGKVYFPRLVVPLATCTSNLVKFGIQFSLFLIVYAVFAFRKAPVAPNAYALLVPALVVLLAMLGLGFGIVFSSMTTKYRDLRFLLGFFVQLWMYATPVIYPLSAVTNAKLKFLMQLNPITPIMESFRYALLGAGSFSWGALVYSAGFALVLLALGIVVFNRVQRSFVDTV